MTSPNKRKGSTWERDLERFLAPLGAHRPRHQWGCEDSGDLHGLSPFVGQAKNYTSVADALREGVAGAERQAVVAGEPFGVAFVKRRGKGAADGYAVMRIDTFARLLAHLRGRSKEHASHRR